MARSVASTAHAGLERSCGDWVRTLGPVGGVELLQARFAGRGFAPHRHDTYGIAVTDTGVQTFDYRGSVERSLPGQVTVLHPDELHDGRAGSEHGFGYRIVYLAPERVGQAVAAVLGRPAALPFLRTPVLESPSLASAVQQAFRAGVPEPLARDALVVRLAEGLVAADRCMPAVPDIRLDVAALSRARDLLQDARGVVRSAELEHATGLSRYVLARQFRAYFGTSPYRYSVLRRLDRARDALRAGRPLVDVALDHGFADQAHFTRMFRASYGLTPQRYAHLVTVPVRGRAVHCGGRDAGRG